MNKIALGGGCHWCTEGIFLSLNGIKSVEQGWISAKAKPALSEAVIITFNPTVISLADLIEIHLHTHSSTSNHTLRQKYRSAVYVFSKQQKTESEAIIQNLQSEFDNKLVTQVLHYNHFKKNVEEQLNYLYTRKSNQFCERYIHPKLTFLLEKYSDKVNVAKLALIEEFNKK